MHALFDPNQFHPTFLGENIDNLNHSQSFNNYHHISMDSFLNMVNEYGLTDDIIASAITTAYDFFGLQPGLCVKGGTTGIDIGNPITMADDVIMIDKDDLKTLGVHDKETLSLIFTHELVHGLTQYVYATGELTPWQSELISDKWMGFRAAVEGMDIQKVIATLDGTEDSVEHPGEDLRKEHIQQAYDTMKSYIEQGVPANFDTMMQTAALQIQNDPNVIEREKAAEATGILDPDRQVLGYSDYSQSEINSHIKEAEDKIDYYKGLIKRNEEERDFRASHGLPTNTSDSTIGRAQIDLENAKKELNKWKNTEARKK